MKKFLTLTLLLLLAIVSTARATGGDESVLIEEKAIKYKDWTFADLQTGKPVRLRDFVANKRLVLVVYFAPWCGNWRAEAPRVARLYEKYKAQGFDVVAVNNYATKEDAKKFFGDKGAPYTVVVESESGDARTKTSHYECRISTGDKRMWGSPYNVFIEPAKISKTGDVLMERAFVASGEIIEEDADKFIAERLGVKEIKEAKPKEAARN
jgi:thiol-disulfide isomerase/thioredoxin